VGITLNLCPAVPASPSPEDHDASRHFDGYFNRWFLEPLYHRSYPSDMVSDYVDRGYLDPARLRFLQADDLEAIAVPTDFLGVNYYNRAIVRSDRIAEEKNQPRTVAVGPEAEITEMGWEVYPDGLFQTLVRVASEYGVTKVFVTENGASYSDGPDPRGRVADERRLRFIRDHLLQAHRAIEAGVPLAGYFVWSLLDNFEWERGYRQRFGVTWVDYATQQRIPKDSALWYRQVIEANAVIVD
jgi:beta-glucosidase